jgi:geranylgeranyl pyrophosphate synthase
VGRAFQLTDDLLDFMEAAGAGSTTGGEQETAVNLAARMGVDAVREEAAAQVQVALDEVDGLGGDAVLCAIASFIRDRRM